MPPLRLFNTYSKSVEPFSPLDPDGRTVRMYSCGPTVYSYAHIGNFRSFLTADLLRRVLERHGYAVRHVMNITDVGHMTQDHLADATGEDKLSKAARELGWDPYQVAAHFEKAFVADAKALRLKNFSSPDAEDPALHPRATEHVAEMLAMIQTLIERNHAYVDSEGQVYFDVASFPEYGKLSGKVLEDLEAGARVAVRSEKRDPRDFALWKVDSRHLMQWDPHGPNGWRDDGLSRLQSLRPEGVDARLRAGFPGWHIECSAMARAHLGPVIDIHTGGEDNVFPHHECEIAQSWGAATEPNPPSSFSRHWVHVRHLLVDGAKMSKRDGTFFTVRDMLDPRGNGREELAKELEKRGFRGGRVPANVLRYALLSNAYRAPMNFTLDVLVQAKSAIERLEGLRMRLAESAGPGQASTTLVTLVAECRAAFDEALCDDLNVPRALAAVFRFASEVNQQGTIAPADATASLAFLDEVDAVLDVVKGTQTSGALERDALTQRAEAHAGDTLDSLLTVIGTDREFVERMLALRHRAKQSRDFATADRVRKELVARGVEVEDTATGVRYVAP